MCGYFGNIGDSPLSYALMSRLGLENQAVNLRNNPGTGPASLVDIIRYEETGVKVARSIWWLLLEHENAHLRPSRYTSFNTRSDKLNVKRSAGYLPFRQSRCIIPATYIIEGEGAKGARRYHRIEPNTHAFALGGLYLQWTNHDTGEHVLSCSVITLPPHPDWKAMHSKSTPLFLPVENSELIAHWLDPDFDDVSKFAPLLYPALHDNLTCTAVERPGNQVVIGEPFRIRA